MGLKLYQRYLMQGNLRGDPAGPDGAFSYFFSFFDLMNELQAWKRRVSIWPCL